MAIFESNELASDSEDEKRLFKAEKEAERRSKLRKSSSFAGLSSTAPRPSGRGKSSGLAFEAAWQQCARARVLGPFYGCG